MQAVILAGGLGQRLRPFTEVIPKPLLPLGEKTIMEVQITALRDHGATEIFVATNYMSDLVEAYLGDGSKFGIPVRISREQEPLGTCGPLGLLRQQLTRPFIVINGDILTKLDFGRFYDFAVAQGAILTLGTKIVTTPFRFGNVLTDENDSVIGVEEKPELKMEVLAGIYCLTPECLAVVPEGRYFGMDDLIRTLLDQKKRIARFLIEDYWLDIGQIEDYSKARESYENSLS